MQRFLFIKDAVRGIECMINQQHYDGRTYNLSSGVSVSMKQLADYISNEMEICCYIEKPCQQFTIPRGKYLSINNGLFVENMKWKPEYNLSQGISDTCIWYRENTDWWSVLKRTF